MRIILFFIILIFSYPIYADNASFNAYIPFSNYKPVIDGVIEEEWQSAWTMNLVINKGEDKGKTPLFPTIVKLMWDKDNLYVAFICYDDNICRKIYGRDSDLWCVNSETEVCEMLLCFDQEGKTYYELNLHPSGALLDTRVEWVGKNISFDKSWNSETSCKTYTYRSGDRDIFWSAEFAISWKSFNFTPKSGAYFTGNFYRVNNDSERLAWIPTNAWFHVPQRFGNVYLK